MSNALKLSGYFTLILGICISIYFVSSLEWLGEPHPLKIPYSLVTLAVTLPLGIGSVVLSRIYETLVSEKYDTSDYKKRSQAQANQSRF